MEILKFILLITGAFIWIIIALFICYIIYKILCKWILEDIFGVIYLIFASKEKLYEFRFKPIVYDYYHSYVYNYYHLYNIGIVHNTKNKLLKKLGRYIIIKRLRPGLFKMMKRQ